MTAELIARVRARGADLVSLGAVLRVLHPERLEAATIEELRREKPAVMRALGFEQAKLQEWQTVCASDAIAAAERILSHWYD